MRNTKISVLLDRLVIVSCPTRLVTKYCTAMCQVSYGHIKNVFVGLGEESLYSLLSVKKKFDKILIITSHDRKIFLTKLMEWATRLRSAYLTISTKLCHSTNVILPKLSNYTGETYKVSEREPGSQNYGKGFDQKRAS